MSGVRQAKPGEWMPVPYVDEHSAELLFRHKMMRLLHDEGHSPSV
ncbi:MAG: hypothetical protein ACC742_13895 [Thermoanaerobaculales bacterium]